jgi:hypothetical protein
LIPFLYLGFDHLLLLTFLSLLLCLGVYYAQTQNYRFLLELTLDFLFRHSVGIKSANEDLDWVLQYEIRRRR